MPKFVFISDTHNRLHRIAVPMGDVLVHAGDMTGLGNLGEIGAFGTAVRMLRFPRVLATPGNHDHGYARDLSTCRQVVDPVQILIDQEVEIEGVRIWMSPWTPIFSCWAFMKNEEQLREIYSKIPEGIDVLVTHGPPRGILDKTISGELAGSIALLEAVKRVKPRYHVFGHIHEGYGQIEIEGTRFINASILDETYMPVNSPVVIDIEKKAA